jgi:hypothetical protein
VDEEDARAQLQARLHTLIGGRAPVSKYVELLTEAKGVLQAHDPLLFEIRYYLEHAEDNTRGLRASVRAWTTLYDEARSQLPETDASFRDIESSYLRNLRIYGPFGSLDEVVELRTRRLDRLVRELANEDSVGIARTDLATALIDRGRFGDLEPLSVAAGEADLRARLEHDLRTARNLSTDEIDRRTTSFGTDHPLTWHARASAVAALVALLSRGWAPAAAGQAEDETRALIDHYRHDQSHHLSLLRAKLLAAEVHIATGRHEDAEREATRVSARCPSREEGLDRGHALLVLARAQEARSRVDALSNAERALNLRNKEFPKRGHKVAEAQRLVTTLSAWR